MPTMKRVLILGATSAVASEVARIHASKGARIHLVGRNEAKLSAVAEACASVTTSVTSNVTSAITSQAADFSDLASCERVVRDAFEALGTIDIALIAHGELSDQLETEKAFAAAERAITVNFTSVVALLIPLANRFEGEGRGSIGVITSVAGDRGRPRNYTYGAAKGALNVYLQGLRTRLYARGVSVTTIKLGPVDSPMTKDHKKHALFGTPSGVAKDIVAAMDARVPEAYVPAFWGAIMPVVKNTPEGLFQMLPFLSGR